MTRSHLRLPFAAAAVTLGVLAWPAPAQDVPADMASYAPAQLENYEVFKVRCSKCHPLTRPLNTRLKPEAWRQYVEKMKRRPGSGISPADGTRIVAFLQYREARRSYEAGDGPNPDGPDAGTK